MYGKDSSMASILYFVNAYLEKKKKGNQLVIYSVYIKMNRGWRIAEFHNYIFFFSDFLFRK